MGKDIVTVRVGMGAPLGKALNSINNQLVLMEEDLPKKSGFARNYKLKRIYISGGLLCLDYRTKLVEVVDAPDGD